MDLAELRRGRRWSWVTSLLVVALMAAFFLGRATAPLATPEKRGVMSTRPINIRFVEADRRAAMIHLLTGRAVAHLDRKTG